jgi:hypothetical protein
MQKILKTLGLLSFFSIPLSNAGLFKINVISTNGITADQANAVTSLIADEVNKKLPSADTQEDYFKGMSNANTISAAGMTTSYAPVFKNILVGVSVSAGADLGSKNFTDFKNISKNPEQFRGFGGQAAILLGLSASNFVNSSWIKDHPLNFYLSGFSIQKNLDKVDAKYMGAGLGVQYKLINEKNWGARSLKWTGIELGSGIMYSKLDIAASIPLNDNFSVDNSGTSLDVSITDASALLNANVKTFSIPLELSTGLRIAYLLKIVGGVGADISFGKTLGTGSLSSGNKITAVNAGNGITDATGELDLNGSQSPDIINPRFFFGPHIEFGFGSVFANLQKSLSKNVVAVNGGLNLFW